MTTPDRYGQGKATLITQHEKARHYGHKPGEWFYGCDACNPVHEPVDDEVHWCDIQRAITKAMEDD